jgi:dihydroxyacetone kinase-like protein
MDDIKTLSLVGADDVLSSENTEMRRGVAGIYFMYKAAGARAAQMGTLEEVAIAAQKAGNNVRTVGFALTPCVVPEVGHANFELAEDEMAFGMGIHGEPGIWNGPVKTAEELAEEAVSEILKDMPLPSDTEVALLINGLGATSIEELYILNNAVRMALAARGIRTYRSWTGEYATSMEMAGASISLCQVDDELKGYFDYPVDTPFLCQR